MLLMMGMENLIFMKNDTNCCDENTVDVGACKKPMG